MNGGDFAELLRGDSIVLGMEADAKPALLASLAQRIAPIAGLPAAAIGEAVRQREALGSTGFGQGSAIPHARLAGLDAVTVLVARLAEPMEWGALDGVPVDLVVLLLSPEEVGADHLKALARISRALRNPQIAAAMRAAVDAEAMHKAIDRPRLAAERAA